MKNQLNVDRSVLTLCEDQYGIGHRVLVQMEGTAHIDFPKIETAEAINFKFLPVMHMQKL